MAERIKGPSGRQTLLRNGAFTRAPTARDRPRPVRAKEGAITARLTHLTEARLPLAPPMVVRLVRPRRRPRRPRQAPALPKADTEPTARPSALSPCIKRDPAPRGRAARTAIAAPEAAAGGIRALGRAKRIGARQTPAAADAAPVPARPALTVIHRAPRHPGRVVVTRAVLANPPAVARLPTFARRAAAPGSVPACAHLVAAPPRSRGLKHVRRPGAASALGRRTRAILPAGASIAEPA